MPPGFPGSGRSPGGPEPQAADCPCSSLGFVQDHSTLLRRTHLWITESQPPWGPEVKVRVGSWVTGADVGAERLLFSESGVPPPCRKVLGSWAVVSL